MEEKQINEINDSSAPGVIEHFVGQENVKALVKTALEASWQDGTTFPNTLALGDAGLGKTAISNLIAKEMASNYHEVLAGSFKNVSDMHGFLLSCKEKDILFFDELHSMKKDLMLVLYRAMDSKKVFLKMPNRKEPCTITLPDLCITGATTDYHSIPKPMLDRFKLVLFFEHYSENEIKTILKNRCARIGWKCSEETYDKISRMSRGVPRIGLRILENTHRVARSESSDYIIEKHLDANSKMEGLDCLGLNKEERKLLAILAQRNGTPVRLGTLAMTMGSLSKNLTETIEPYLFRAGLITKDDKGRMLTPKGYEHIMNNPVE